MIEIKNLSFYYPKSKNVVLENINLQLNSGKLYTLEGKSGAGKTTLLKLIAGIYLPKSGEIFYKNQPYSSLNLYNLRCRHIGFIPQDNMLFPNLTVEENLCYPQELLGKNVKEAKAFSKDILMKLGINQEKLYCFPSELSGGQQQRVAIARCLLINNMIILADEPSGNLDSENSKQVLEILQYLAHEEGKLVIISTHDSLFLEDSDYRLHLAGGEIHEL